MPRHAGWQPSSSGWLRSLPNPVRSRGHHKITSRHRWPLWVWFVGVLTSLCHSNGHIETMPAREINPFYCPDQDSIPVSQDTMVGWPLWDPWIVPVSASMTLGPVHTLNGVVINLDAAIWTEPWKAITLPTRFLNTERVHPQRPASPTLFVF